uniref:Uncharacterized protein n=1 Tax=Oryza nivara TaxID=4536 RepID=A0A0E0ISE5_ORYNI
MSTLGAHIIAVQPIRRRHVLQGSLVTDGHFAASQDVARVSVATPRPRLASSLSIGRRRASA